MQQNCQITCRVRQYTMDSVLKSAKPRCGLTGNRNDFAHASPKLHELLGDKFANCISNNSNFNIFYTIEIQNQIWIVSTSKLYLYQEIYHALRQFPFFGVAEASVTSHTGHSQWQPLSVESRRLIARNQNQSWMCKIRLIKLSCAAQQVGIVHFYGVTEIKGLSCRPMNAGVEKFAHFNTCGLLGLSCGQSRVARH